jgi:hypothetical protein
MKKILLRTKLLAFFIFCFTNLCSNNIYAQKQSNQTCRITSTITNSLIQDAKSKLCKSLPATCNAVVASIKDEFALNPNWNGVKQYIYDGCTWILKGRELTYYVPLDKAQKFINDLKSSSYFSNVRKQ